MASAGDDAVTHREPGSVDTPAHPGRSRAVDTHGGVLDPAESGIVTARIERFLAFALSRALL
jgi:hypothetical protein